MMTESLKNKQYRIVETHCYPNSWKVASVLGTSLNSAFLFHSSIDKAKEQIEKKFNGKVLEIIYLEN